MSITAERLMVEVQADVRDALRKLDQVEAASGRTTSRLSKMSRSLGLAFGGAAVVQGITKTVSLAMNFDTTMRQVGIQTDQSGKKLKALGDLALEMGKKTAYSAQDAGGAMLELAKGGMSAADIRAGALDQTLRLAAAGGVELASAAGYIVQGMNTYGLSAKKAVQITTALAGGANASTASVESMGLALSQVGPGAVNAGMSIQETVAALAAFDNAGIKGSDAGTSLKTMLASLVPTTKKAKNAMADYGLEFVKRNGDFKSMAEVAQELKDGLGDLGQAERVAAMKTIFGSDATRAATVLMKQGSKGVKDYVRATNDRTKAQEMADAAMKGAKGAWENFKGSVETAAIIIGTKLLPGFTKAADAGADFVSDALSWGPQIQESFGWTIDVAEGLGGALKPVVGLVKTLASAWSGLPGPIKETGTQILLAALLFPRLASAATSASAQVTGAWGRMTASAKLYAGTAGTAEARTKALTGAAQTLAGVAGLVLLTKSADASSDSLSSLGTVAGGAALGFSMGGPWGAAIGTLAGVGKATWDVTDRQRDAKDAVDAAAQAMSDATTKAGDYAASLDQVTGAATKQTRAEILAAAEKANLLDIMRKIGVSNRDLIGSVLGQEGATKRLTTAFRDNLGALTATEQVNLNQWLSTNTHGFAIQSQAIRDAERDTKTWAQALKGLPPKVRSEVKAIGVDITTKQLKELKKRYDLTPKQVRTIVNATGTETTIRKVKGVWTAFQDGKKIPAASNQWMDAWVTGLVEGSGQGEKAAKRGADGVLSALGKTDRAKANLGLFTRSVTNALTDLKPQANAGGTGVGQAITSGAASGIAATVAQVAAQAAAMVRAAIAAARAAAKAKSPSRETMALGNDMGDGLAEGMKARARAVASAGAGLARRGVDSIRDALRGGQGKGKAPKPLKKDEVRDRVQDFAQGLKGTKGEMTKAFKELNALIRRNMSGKKEAKWLEKSEKAQNKLEKLYAKRERIEKKLADAQTKLADLTQAKADFVSGVESGMSTGATVIGAGSTAAGIASSLSSQVAKVKKFAEMLGQLRSMGYSDDIVKEVASAGVDGGYQAAKALVAANASQVASMNADYATIKSTATSTAASLGGELYDAGIAAAQGLVQGLKDNRDAVEAEILAIAKAMVKSIKKALGIASPSKVFRSLGAFTGKGLVAGLHGQEKAVTAASMGLGAASLAGATYASTKGLSAGSFSGGGSTGNAVTFQFTTHNPQAEPQSRTTNDALTRAAVLGVLG